jgi:nucleoside-diphosphate-sugar epimerase
VLFPISLFECAPKKGTKLFINIDTMLQADTSIYSLSKSQFRQCIKYLSSNISVVNIKLEHFYGPGVDTSNFIGNVIYLLCRNELSVPLTLGEQKRDFIFIDDVINAIIIILKHSLIIKVNGWTEYEVGTGIKTTIRFLVEKIKILSNNTTSQLIFGAIPYRKNDFVDISINLTPLFRIGWNYRWDLDSGLLKCISFERNN